MRREEAKTGRTRVEYLLHSIAAGSSPRLERHLPLSHSLPLSPTRSLSRCFVGSNLTDSGGTSTSLVDSRRRRSVPRRLTSGLLHA